MDVVGYIAVILVAIMVLGVIILSAISFPDILRYLKIRNM